MDKYKVVGYIDTRGTLSYKIMVRTLWVFWRNNIYKSSWGGEDHYRVYNSKEIAQEICDELNKYR